MKYIFLFLICVFTTLATYSIMDCVKTEKQETTLNECVSVEKTIKEDITVMDTISDNYVFYESRIVLNTPFNETDDFNPSEITNVFQSLTKDEQGIDQPTVYMFVHTINGSSYLEKHEGAFMTDDIALNIDSIKIDFIQAFTLLKESNYPPSKSQYITLRHGFGRYTCNPFYTIGNDTYGHLWVDAITGDVTDKDPASIQK